MIRTWDLNLDGGIGARFLGPAKLTGFGRIRGGITFIDERDLGSPRFFSLGLTYEASSFSPGTFGIQAESMSLSSGSWFQLGAMVDLQPRPGFMAAFGWSVVGVEGQLRWDKERTDSELVWAVYGKIRIPISVIALALKK